MFKHDSCVTFMCDILSICTVSYNIFTHKVDGPYLVHYLLIRLYLIGGWLGAHPRTDTIKTFV
jgi:hypothetical protein